MNFTNFVALARIIQHTLGGGRFTRINMGHNAEVAVVFNFVTASHDVESFKNYQR